MGLNVADVLILILIALAVAWAVRMIIKHNREGSACCGGGDSGNDRCAGGCTGCHMASCRNCDRHNDGRK